MFDTVKLEWMPWESQVPALLSKRTDVIAGNIHHTAERDKVISFSGPAYWYGPVIVVAKGNPLGIKSYDDLRGMTLQLSPLRFADLPGRNPLPFSVFLSKGNHTPRHSQVAGRR